MGNIIGAARPASIGKKIAAALIAVAVGTALALGSAAVQPAEAHAATKAPAKVASVKAKAKSTSSIKVTWKRAKGAKTYQLAYKKSGSKSWKTKTVKSRSATVKKLADNTKYTFKVRGAAGKKKGKWSAVKSCATKAATPAKVTGLTVEATSEGKAKLSWSKAENADAYEVSYSVDGGSWKTKSTSSASLTVSGLSSGDEVQAKVRGLNKGAKTVKGAWSETASGSSAPHSWKAVTEQVTYPDGTVRDEVTGYECANCGKEKAAEAEPGGHVHSWQAVTETVHHDAVTEEVPVYSDNYAATECKGNKNGDVCGRIFIDSDKWSDGDNAGVARDAGCGHTGSWNQVRAQVGTEQKVVQKDYDQTVQNGYRCTDCGAAKGAHAHNWVEKMRTVHHCAQVELVPVSGQAYVCSCGMLFDMKTSSYEANYKYTLEGHLKDNPGHTGEYAKKSAVVGYEIVQTSAAYDEQEAYYVCSICNLEK